MAEPVFVLDANVFMEAARRYYAFDLVPPFWETLVEFAEAGRLESIDRVKKEIEKGKDDLAEWAGSHFSDAFASTDEDSINALYADIMSWVESQTQYTDAAKADFAGDADGWLVAYAKTKNRILITHEVAAPDAKAKIPIPNVCLAFDVEFEDTFQMLRKLGVRFG
jgi:hypothetical protein